MADEADRERLAMTFDSAADLYQRARPDYPVSVYERLLAVTGLAGGARLVEVGCATGKATVPLARMGFHITCIEPGPALATVARRNLSAFPVAIIETKFEDWVRTGEPFELVYAATSWGWVDPRVKCRKAAEALRPGGYLAIWNAGHVIPYDGDPFFEEIQEVYDELGEANARRSIEIPRPGAVPDQRGEIEASRLFDVLDTWQFDWETRYDADGYIDLLNTFSGHIAMQDWRRERLYGEIRRRLAARPDGMLRRHWGGVLQIARLPG